MITQRMIKDIDEKITRIERHLIKIDSTLIKDINIIAAYINDIKSGGNDENKK